MAPIKRSLPKLKFILRLRVNRSTRNVKRSVGIIASIYVDEESRILLKKIVLLIANSVQGVSSPNNIIGILETTRATASVKL